MYFYSSWELSNQKQYLYIIHSNYDSQIVKAQKYSSVFKISKLAKTEEDLGSLFPTNYFTLFNGFDE